MFLKLIPLALLLACNCDMALSRNPLQYAELLKHEIRSGDYKQIARMKTVLGSALPYAKTHEELKELDRLIYFLSGLTDCNDLYLQLDQMEQNHERIR